MKKSPVAMVGGLFLLAFVLLGLWLYRGAANPIDEEVEQVKIIPVFQKGEHLEEGMEREIEKVSEVDELVRILNAADLSDGMPKMASAPTEALTLVYADGTEKISVHGTTLVFENQGKTGVIDTEDAERFRQLLGSRALKAGIVQLDIVTFDARGEEQKRTQWRKKKDLKRIIEHINHADRTPGRVDLAGRPIAALRFTYENGATESMTVHPQEQTTLLVFEEQNALISLRDERAIKDIHTLIQGEFE